MRPIALLLTLFATLLAQPLGVAEAQESVAPDLRAAILLRAIAYERGFSGADGPAVLAVVGSATGIAANDATDMVRAFRRLAGRRRVAGRQVRVVRIAHASVAGTRQALASQSVDIVYVAKGLNNVAQQLGGSRIVVCGDPGQVGQGCLLGIEAAEQGSRIVIDARAMRRAGLNFDARLLRLARIVR